MGQGIPSTFNGKSTEYHLFDGFTDRGLLGKACYILGFPYVSIGMELYSHNQASHAAQDARDAVAAQEAPAKVGRSTSISGAPAMDIGPPTPTPGVPGQAQSAQL